MLDEDIVKYALEHKALIVTRDKDFNYYPARQRKEDYPPSSSFATSTWGRVTDGIRAPDIPGQGL